MRAGGGLQLAFQKRLQPGKPLASPNSALRGLASRSSAVGVRAGKGRKVMAGKPVVGGVAW